MPENPKGITAIIVARCGAVANVAFDTEDQKSGVTRVKRVKHDFRIPRSCNKDIKGLTKTLLDGKETGVRQPGPLKTMMLVKTLTHSWP